MRKIVRKKSDKSKEKESEKLRGKNSEKIVRKIIKFVAEGYLGSCRGCQSHNRHAGEAATQRRSELAILRSKLVPPLAHAVRLIHSNVADVELTYPSLDVRGCQGLNIAKENMRYEGTQGSPRVRESFHKHPHPLSFPRG